MSRSTLRSRISVKGKIYDWSKQSFRYSRHQTRELALAAIVLFPFGYFMERAFVEPHYDSLAVRLVVAILAIPLFLFERISGSLFGRHFHYYWTLGITIAFPACFGIILVLNAALTPINQEMSIMWALQYVVALFLFVQLAINPFFAIALWLIASAACAVTLLSIENPNWAQIESNVFDLSGVFLTAILVGAITNRNLEVVQQEKLSAASSIGANIAHELRTPLATIRGISFGLGRHMELLMEGYECAVRAEIVEKKLSPERIQKLHGALGEIEKEVAYSNSVIDMLLLSTSEDLLTQHSPEIFRARTMLQNAFSRYPFNNSKERSLVSLQLNEDFAIRAPKLLVIHVVFNLIKNSLYHVQRSGSGHIFVSVRRGNKWNTITVLDTGPGIPISMRRKVFERFFSTKEDGTGIGLTYCRAVMRLLKGEINLSSVEGQHTTIDLNFPKVAD